MEYAIECKVRAKNNNPLVQDILEGKKQEIRYLAKDRKIILSIKEKQGNSTKAETILFRSKNTFFIEKNGRIIASGETREACAKNAFLDGYISDSDYITLRAGSDAAHKYGQKKRNNEKLGRH